MSAVSLCRNSRRYKENDIGLYLDRSGSTKKMINIDGGKLIKSKLTKCADGYAAGYYHYATEEKMEVFVPVKNNYIMNIQSYSVKPDHRISFTATYNYVGSNSKGLVKEVRKTYSNNVWFNSGFIQRGFSMR